MNNSFFNIISIISDNLWLIVVLMVTILGIYFSIRFKCIQFNIKKMLKYLLMKEEKSDGISSFKTLSIALAGRIGVGSISGVALAIYIGGPGTIFWIWIMAILSSMIAYAETYLGIKYREKGNNNINNGGPEFYIDKGLHKHKLAIMYIVVFFCCYVFGFNSIQSNTITKAVSETFNITPIIVASILSIIAFIIIFKGEKIVANPTSKLVPFMSLIYILLALFILIKNYQLIPSMITMIFKGAFNFKSFTSGFIITMITGAKRGLFSNEAGLGTGSIAAATGNNDNAIRQGYIQMLGIYITSIIICTATAIIIMSSNYSTLFINDPNGIEIASNAFNYHLGDIGSNILTIIITLFAFSTILSGYYYGVASLKYLFKKDYSIILKLITALIIFMGGLISSTTIWTFTDALIGILIIINVTSIFILRKEIKA